MSEQTIRRTERIVDLRTAMPWLVAAGIYVLVIALAPQLLGDPDTYSHLAFGRWILDHGAVPTVDPFSANFRRTGSPSSGFPRLFSHWPMPLAAGWAWWQSHRLPPQLHSVC